MLHSATPDRRQLTCSTLPLAVYREVVAHLRQVTGVNAGLLPQRSTQFDYQQSQVGGLWIEIERIEIERIEIEKIEIERIEIEKIEMPPDIGHHAAAPSTAQQQVEQILAYYGNRYGNWEPVTTNDEQYSSPTRHP